MRVKLVDLDSKIPNLALMQISTMHKQQGDIVGFDVENPDKVYISCIFSKNKEQAYGVKSLYPNADVDIGGTGVDIRKTAPELSYKAYPDYSLYPEINYSMGFTTRGCIRKCPFCVVPQKEGMIHRWQHVSEFYNPKFRDVYFLDNNMYALKDWFFDNTDFVLEHNLRMSVSQGFDVRILDDEIAERLHVLKFSRKLNFAFDNMKDEKAVIRGIEMLKQHGINVRSSVSFFVLVGFNTTFEEDLYRVNLLRDLGVGAFVMKYKSTPLLNMLARYANRRFTYWKFPFEQYEPYVKYAKKEQIAC